MTNIPKHTKTDKRDFLVQIFDGSWQSQELSCDTPATSTCIAIPDGATHAVTQQVEAHPICFVQHLGDDQYQQRDCFDNKWFGQSASFGTFMPTRTLIWQCHDFAIDDAIVLIDSDDDGLYIVKHVIKEFIYAAHSAHLVAGRVYRIDEVRHATSAERRAKHRLPDPVALFVSSLTETPYRMYESQAIAILDIGVIHNIESHVSPSCKVINQNPAEDTYLMRALKAQGEVP